MCFGAAGFKDAFFEARFEVCFGAAGFEVCFGAAGFEVCFGAAGFEVCFGAAGFEARFGDARSIVFKSGLLNLTSGSTGQHIEDITGELIGDIGLSKLS
jgi:hypothetical protein